MLSKVVAANLLVGTLGGLTPGIDHYIGLTNGKDSLQCSPLCDKFGSSGWSSRWVSWNKGSPIQKCVCKSQATVEITCKKTGKIYSGCTGSQTGGSATFPPQVEEKDPALLNDFMAECAESNEKRYAQRNGEVTDTKVLPGVGDAQCSDLAMNCIVRANREGFIVDKGHRGNVPGMRRSWAWSPKIVDYKDALPGDVAQFSSWKEKYRSTGPKHTAIVTKAYDAAKDELEMLDQNPSPVTRGVYHPSPAGHSSGKLIIYRMESHPHDPSTIKKAPLKAEEAAIAKEAAKPAPPPPKPAKPTPKPAAPPPCNDNHAAIIAAAKAAGDDEGQITGCADAKKYCKDKDYGHIVRTHCPKTCKTCPARLFPRESPSSDEYGDYAKELQDQVEPTVESKMPALMIGACAVVLGVVALTALRLKSRRATDVAFMPAQMDEAGLE